MKTLLLFFIIVGLISGCTEQDDNQDVEYKIFDACYQGHFVYKDTDYFCLICFDDNKYEEWPSGGAMFQKSLSCLTVGRYSINGKILSFELDSFKFSDYPENCVSDMLLPGEYELTEITDLDSLIFEKGTGNNRIIYCLKK